MRSAVFFTLFYVVIPTALAFLSVRAHVAAQPDQGMSAVGLDTLFVMVPFYLYAAGSVHFSYTNLHFLRRGIVQDVFARLLTWDIPCQIWVTGSLLVERQVFGKYDSSCVLILVTMSFALPVIAVIVAGLSYPLLPKEVRAMTRLRELGAQPNRSADKAGDA